LGHLLRQGTATRARPRRALPPPSWTSAGWSCAVSQLLSQRGSGLPDFG